MPLSATTSRSYDPVKQFAVFVENKVGRLSEVIAMLGSHNVHVMAISTMDTTDSTVLRVIVDDPKLCRNLFLEQGVPFNEAELVAVEINTEADLKFVLAALLEAEINIHYLYSFLCRPRGKSGIAFNIEDRDLAVHALETHGFKVLGQGDISR